MSKVHLTIDGQKVVANEGDTLLDAARAAGISIPTLCHHEKLVPYGGCRLCMVELDMGSWIKRVVACVYTVEPDLKVATQSQELQKIRRNILELLLAHAPDSPPLVRMAEEYGADRYRFEQDPSFCIHCGLCVRYCAEVVGKHAVGFIDRGIRKEISFIPEIAAAECNDCKECFPLCPTSYLQAAFVLTEALTFPSGGSGSASKE
jgi:NADH dehydrogenase/NADH:ubiquinone oxidoreductase subunit G